MDSAILLRISLKELEDLAMNYLKMDYCSFFYNLIFTGAEFAKILSICKMNIFLEIFFFLKFLNLLNFFWLFFPFYNFIYLSELNIIYMYLNTVHIFAGIFTMFQLQYPMTFFMCLLLWSVNFREFWTWLFMVGLRILLTISCRGIRPLQKGVSWTCELNHLFISCHVGES